MLRIKEYIGLTRPYNALLPVVAIIAGYTVSQASDVPKLVLSIVSYVILHGVVTVWNDFEDEAADAHNNIHRIKTVRLRGSYQIYKRTNIVLAVLGVAMGLWLPFPGIILLGSVVVIGWLYNSPPFRLSRRPIWSMVLMLLFYGWIPIALGIALGVWRWQALVLGLGWAIGRLSLSILKDYKDAVGDAKADKRTFLLVYGGRRTAQVSLVLLCLSVVAVMCIAADYHRGIALLGILVPAAWLVRERLKLFTYKHYADLNMVFRKGLRYQLAFDVLVVVWLHIY